MCPPLGKITENPDFIYIVKEAELFRSEYCETTYSIFLEFLKIDKGTSKYDAITLRNIFTPPPLLSYCVIIRRTSGWW